jgi:DGQHR domain-containing protein
VTIDRDLILEQALKVPCLEISQPIGTFYVGVMKHADLTRITFSDVRRIESEQRDVESYLGIERPLSQKRVAELKQYVENVDASFPSSVILAVRSSDAEFDAEERLLYIRDERDIAKVLDGQHRIAGLEGYRGEPFEIIITVFIDIDIEEQALVFATINLEQTKVNKSLAYDLYEYASHRSPQKTAHNIARLLDAEDRSPFKGKIKILGSARDRGETISQALFIDSLLPMISSTPARDRDSMKRGRGIARADRAEEVRLVFRNMFIDDRDADIAWVIWNFFGAVEDKWGEFWRDAKPGFVLNRTTGFRALMDILPRAYLMVGGPGTVPSRESFNELFSRVQIRGEEITPENFAPGVSGQVALRRILLVQMGLE